VGFTLAFALQLRKKHGKTSIRLANMMLRKVSGLPCEEVTGEWNKLHDWYFSARK
jgi:hypothetical protein